MRYLWHNALTRTSRLERSVNPGFVGESKRSRAKAQRREGFLENLSHCFSLRTLRLCASKKLNHHSFLGNSFHHWLSEHCRKFLVFLSQDSIGNCLTDRFIQYLLQTVFQSFCFRLPTGFFDEAVTVVKGFPRLADIVIAIGKHQQRGVIIRK